MRVKTDSISKYLREKKGVTNARPGKKSKCPDCGKNTLYIKPNDEIATCFHPAHPGCNYWIVKSQEIETVDEVLQSFFTELELVGRATFRRQLYAEPIGSLETKKKSAIEYFRERGINEDVLENWPVAIVPHKSMIKELLKTHFSPLEKKFAQSNQDEQELEKLKNIRKKLDLLKNQSGSLLFLYSNLSGFTGFRLRKPYEPKDKAFTSQWFYEQHGCLWLNHQISPAKSKKVFLFEGEMDLLSFFSLGGKINDTFILTTCGSATSVDVETITKLSLAPFVFADNDDAGKKMIETMGKDVNVRQVLIPKEFNDIDDWISSFSSKPEAKIAILKAIQNPAWTYRAWDSVREEVNQIRARGADTGLEREQKAQERVQVELRLRGTFYRSGPQGYYHDRKSGILCAVPSGKKLRSHLLRMGVNSKSAFGKETMEFLEVNVSEMARQSKVYKFVHYDKETSQLYISVESGRVIVCSAEGPRVESNGTDGVLFVGDQILVMCPDFGDPSTDYALLDEVLCNINFSVTDLSISQQTALYKLWLISTFFPEIMPTKVIPSLIGPKQSGKSQCLKNFGRLLFGNKFNVVPLPDDPKEFDVIACPSGRRG
jgi:5S rRNA maturation endonuclease (ribonuclease M5)